MRKAPLASRRGSARGRAGTLAAALATSFGAVLLPAATAHADELSDLTTRVGKLEAGATEVGKGLAKPSLTVAGDRRRSLPEAQIAFGMGEYGEASTLLFDYVQQPTRPNDYNIALYFLGEALYRKGDRASARTYLGELVDEQGASAKYYPQALERLIDLATAQGDVEAGNRYAQALAGMPAERQRPESTYARAKWAYATAQYDEALRLFRTVPANSGVELQALFYVATTLIAQNNLDGALAQFEALLTKQPRSAQDKRVLELTSMALGRLHYELDQPSRSVHAYLDIERRSDLFDEVLYEASWVYVKSKQFDKALTTLELLALSDPASQRLPTVKILEGNLRIRRAQLVHDRQVQGIISPRDPKPEDEYGKADVIFTEMGGTYREPHAQLKAIVGKGGDLSIYVPHVTGREATAFANGARLPDVAAAWVRDEPEVDRVISVESDLGEIANSLIASEQTVMRLEIAVGGSNRVNLFASLGERRARIIALQTELFTTQAGLVEAQRGLLAGAGAAELDGLTATRVAAQAAVSDIPNAERAFEEQVRATRALYDQQDAQLAEISGELEASQLTLSQLRQAAADPSAPISIVARFQIPGEADQVEPELTALRGELAEARKEALIGRDEAGAGGNLAAQAQAAREQLRAAFAAEQAALTRLASTDRGRQLAQLAGRNLAVGDKLDAVNRELEQLADAALVDVRAQLDRERAELAENRRAYLELEAESRVLGGAVLEPALTSVRDKFYDIVIRSDVGLVDVSWSQKEAVDNDITRFNQNRSREMKQLRDEFRDLLEEGLLTPGGGASTGTAPKTTTPAVAPPVTDPSTAPAPSTGGTP